MKLYWQWQLITGANYKGKHNATSAMIIDLLITALMRGALHGMMTFVHLKMAIISDICQDSSNVLV